MQFADLVVEGIRRFSKSQKISFKPGFNLIFGSNESGKSTLAEVILELLFADRFREEEISLFNWQGQQNSRAGLTITQGKDTYRVLRDFRANKVTLSKLNPQDQKYETMAEEVTKVSSILADVLNLPAFETYRNIFVNQPGRLPSGLPLEVKAERRPRAAEAEAPASAPAAPGGFPGAMPAQHGPMGFGFQETSYPGMGMPGTMPPGMMHPGMVPPELMQPGMGMTGSHFGYLTEEEIKEKKARLEQLKKEMERAKQVEDVQFEIDGLQAKVFEIEAKKKSVSKIDEALGQAKEIMNQYNYFQNLPDNIEERLDRFNHLAEMQSKEVEKIDEKAYIFEDELYSLKQVPPFYKQSLFNLGAGAFVAGILAFVLKGALAPLVYLSPLLIIAGLGIIGYLLFQFLTLQGKIAELQKKVNDFDNQRQTIIKKFEVEGAVIRRLFDHAETESTDSLKEKIEKFRQVEEKSKNLERRRKETMIEINWNVLDREESELNSKIKQLEEKLRGQQAVTMDPNEMKREIKELEEILGKYKATEPGASVPDLSGPGAAPPGAGSTTQAAPKAPDPGSTRMVDEVPAALFSGASVIGAYELMLAGASTLLGVEREKLIDHISNRLQLYLQAMTGKRYQKAEIKKDKTINLVTSEGGVHATLAQLSPAARDALYFALQFTLLEILVQKYQFPLVLDDPYTHLDETRQQVVSQALKRLSEKTQVILFSTQRIHAKNSAHSLNLG